MCGPPWCVCGGGGGAWGGGGGDSNVKMPGCVCWVYEKGPILNDSFRYKTYPH